MGPLTTIGGWACAVLCYGSLLGVMALFGTWLYVCGEDAREGDDSA